MAIEYNTIGSTDADAWSGSGFAAGATLVAANPGGPWTSNLDQRASNIDYIEWLNAWNANVGSASNPLQFEATTNTSSYARWRTAGGTLFIYAKNASGDSKIENLDVGGLGKAMLLGGEFEDATQDGGHIHCGANAWADNFYAFGGTSLWEAGTALTLAKLIRGSHRLERAAATLTIGPGADVVLNIPGLSISTALNMQGGRLTILAGDCPTVNGDAGEINCMQAERAIVLGGTAFNQGGVKVLYDERTTISNVAQPGQFLPPQPL